MRALLQRVRYARVTVDNQIVGAIDHGLLILLGVAPDDGEPQADTLADKIVHLRIFADEDGKMNRSLLDCSKAALVVSQFTLYADMRRGRRPGFSTAAPPTIAAPLFEYFKSALARYDISVASGIFGADMQVELCNDGPVTLWLDSQDL